MGFLRELVSLCRVFQGLPGILMPGFVVLLFVVHGSNAMSVCGEIVELCGSLVRVVWHILLSPTIGFNPARRQFVSERSA